MNKVLLQEHIKRIIRETINEMSQNNVRQYINESNENDDVEAKKSFVFNALKRNDNDKYDHAHLAYQLWPHMSKDAARSYFSKCVRGERQFSEKDIIKLYNILTSK